MNDTWLLSTVRRSYPIAKGGEVIEFDFHSKEIVRRRMIVPDNPSTIGIDNNKRGNSRGCRGVFRYDGMILACNYHSLLFMDEEFTVIDVVTDHAMVGLHELYFDEIERIVYLTSTTINTVVAVDFEKRVVVDRIYLNADDKVVADLNLTERKELDLTIDYRISAIGIDLKKADDHMHMNAVCKYNGDLYILLNKVGIVYNLSQREILFQDDRLKGGHNLVMQDGFVFSCNTRGHSLIVYSIDKGLVVKDIQIENNKSVASMSKWSKVINVFDSFFTLQGYKVVKPMFCRGLRVKESLAYMGTSPASVVKIDWEKEEIVEVFQLASNPRICIHGMYI